MRNLSAHPSRAGIHASEMLGTHVVEDEASEQRETRERTGYYKAHGLKLGLTKKASHTLSSTSWEK